MKAINSMLAAHVNNFMQKRYLGSKQTSMGSNVAEPSSNAGNRKVSLTDKKPKEKSSEKKKWYHNYFLKKRKDPGYCIDCGSSDHRRSNPKCPTPSFESKRRREENHQSNNADITKDDIHRIFARAPVTRKANKFNRNYWSRIRHHP